MKKFIPLLGAYAFCCSAAMAQQAAPKHNCVKPLDPDNATPWEKVAEFKKAVAAYRDCMTAYSADLTKQSALYYEAANAASAEFNAYAKKVKIVDDAAAKK